MSMPRGCKPCCKFTLYSVANAAVVYTVFNFIFFLLADIFLIICIVFKDAFSKSDSPAFRTFILGCSRLPQQNVVVSILIVRLAIKLFWLISSPLLWIGNRQEKTSYIIWWQSLAMSSLVYSAATAAYYLAVQFHSGFLANMDIWVPDLLSSKPSEKTGEQAAQFCVFSSLLDVVFYVPSLVFVICVYLRCVQIRNTKDNSTSTLIHRWDSIELAPYRIPRPKITTTLTTPPDDSKRNSAPAGYSVDNGDFHHDTRFTPNYSPNIIHTSPNPNGSATLPGQSFADRIIAYDNAAFNRSSEVLEPSNSSQALTQSIYENTSDSPRQQQQQQHLQPQMAVDRIHYYSPQDAIYTRPGPRTNSRSSHSVYI